MFTSTRHLRSSTYTIFSTRGKHSLRASFFVRFLIFFTHQNIGNKAPASLAEKYRIPKAWHEVYLDHVFFHCRRRNFAVRRICSEALWSTRFLGQRYLHMKAARESLHTSPATRSPACLLYQCDRTCFDVRRHSCSYLRSMERWM